MGNFLSTMWPIIIIWLLLWVVAALISKLFVLSIAGDDVLAGWTFSSIVTSVVAWLLYGLPGAGLMLLLIITSGSLMLTLFDS